MEVAGTSVGESWEKEKEKKKQLVTRKTIFFIKLVKVAKVFVTWLKKG